jgi:REP element-mobilizing transposase RayT
LELAKKKNQILKINIPILGRCYSIRTIIVKCVYNCEWRIKSGACTAVIVNPGISVSKIVQYIKGKSSGKLLQEFEVLRKKYWGQHLWARGYFVVTAGNVNEEDVQKYIENQEIHHQEDNFRISEF